MAKTIFPSDGLARCRLACSRLAQGCLSFLSPWGWAMLSGLVLFAVFLFTRISSPQAPVLFERSGAVWIRAPQPAWLGTWTFQDLGLSHVFRVKFTAPATRGATVLKFNAMKRAIVFLDRSKLHHEPNESRAWNKVREVGIPELQPGSQHELLFVVGSRDSHPSLLAWCPFLGLASGPGWEVTGTGNWSPAMPVKSPEQAALARQFPTSIESMGVLWPWLLMAFLVVGVLAWAGIQGRLKVPSASRIRWILMGLLALLAVNNFLKLSFQIGMDSQGHFDYIRHVAIHHRIPLATEGWQMFQAPLYYLLAAPLYALTSALSPEGPALALRVLSWCCGLALVELSYRALREVFPERGDLQVAGLVLVALLPMNLVLAHYVGNEPLSAVIAACALVCCFRRLRQPPALVSGRFGWLLGLLLGLALLAKTSNLLLVLLLPAFCLAWGVTWRGSALKAGVTASIRFLVPYGSALLLTSGWYYARNWWHLDRWFIGGWDPSRGFPWWQDPGAIAAGSLLKFGTALVQPVYAQTGGFLDGLFATFWTDASLSGVISFKFRPPWNYEFLFSGVLLALVPTTLMVLGAIKGRATRHVRLSVTCILVFLAAVLVLYVTTTPFYSTLKASYLLGLMPCFGILLAEGYDRLPKRAGIRAMIAGALGAWGVAVFFGFLIH